jgi:serine protease Do
MTIGAVAMTGALFLAACTGYEARSGSATTASGSGSTSTQQATSTSSTSATTTTTGTYNPNTDPLVQMVRRVEPAVVNVTSTVVENNPFGGQQSGQAVGTGFIVESNGVILTNDHVVEDASSIRVTLPDGRAFPATVVTADSPHDLAVLKVNASGLPIVSLGNSSALQLGQPVVAIGYALALPGGPTVTSGIISSLARTITAQDENAPGGQRTYESALQTSAAINPGNSGGPLLDLNGNVVGIDTAGTSSAQNIGFAIAANAAESILAKAMGSPAVSLSA